MPNLKEVRNRISSVTSTKQITSAMKLVSAAKLKKAQDNITRMRPYAEKLKEILSNLGNAMESASSSPYAEQRDVKRILVVPVTSNKGLCGAFNANVIKKTNTIIREYASSEVHVLSVGRKAIGFFSKRSMLQIAAIEEVVDRPTFVNANHIAENIMNRFTQGEYDKVILVYNEFKTAANQNVIAEQFLPIVPTPTQEKTAGTEYIYQPSREEIVLNLIPASLKTQFFKVIIDSQAAEHGARMTAMHKATDNAGELLKELKLSYNKARQAAITKEILEIVAGAEALK
jgi:F-type H+-transporting ATPase subunit gamma